MSLTLLTLLNDILIDVLDLLSLTDLCNVALLSSQFTGLAQRVLYQSIHLNIETTNNLNRFKVDPGHKFTSLVNTLSQNPHLRLYISALSIRTWNLSFTLRFAGHEELLILIPRLQSLYLDPPPLHFQLLNGSLPLVGTLGLDFSGLNYIGSEEKAEDPIEVIARQFWAPHLRSLYIYGISFNPKMSVLFPSDRHRTASIANLRLKNCGDHIVGCLPDILLCVKTLKCFTLEVSTPWEAAGLDPSAMAPEIIGQFISIHASTLERLEIAGSDAAEFPSTSLIGSLVGYSNIRRLALPEPFLVVVGDEASTLVDVLPPNLEDLQLQFPMLFIQGKDRYRSIRIKRLEQVAAAKIVQFPALRRVVWWSQPAEC